MNVDGTKFVILDSAGSYSPVRGAFVRLILRGNKPNSTNRVLD